jgi:hypothetical protein
MIDDHSISSSDVRSTAVMSVMSFATNDSDPGPSLWNVPSLFFLMREPSVSPLGSWPLRRLLGFKYTGIKALPQPPSQGSIDSSSVSDLVSPPPLHTSSLSLSPAGSWRTLQQSGDGADDSVHQSKPSLGHDSWSRRCGVSCCMMGMSVDYLRVLAPKSAINPIFKVVSVCSA